MEDQQPPIIQLASVGVTGDSIATGIGHNSERGTDFTDAQWGRSPSQQLHLMINRGPQYYRGRDVIISTGILNHEDWNSVEKQFQFLVTSETNTVKVVGTPFTEYNNKLSVLCSRYGFIFIGGYTPGPDGIHPESYAEINQ